MAFAAASMGCQPGVASERHHKQTAAHQAQPFASAEHTTAVLASAAVVSCHTLLPALILPEWLQLKCEHCDWQGRAALPATADAAAMVQEKSCSKQQR